MLPGLLFASAVPEAARAQIHLTPSAIASAQEMSRSPQNAIKVEKPSGGGSADGDVVPGISLNELLAMAKAAKVDFAEIVQSRSQDEGAYVSGWSNGLPVKFYARDCRAESCIAITYFCFFGRQEGVDYKFVTAFNQSNLVKMVRTEDGQLTVSYAIRTFGGVTRKHMQEMTSLFVAAIKTAIDYRPS